MGKLKDQLAGVAALVAAIVAIGGGFVKYGEITTKLEALEAAAKTVDEVSIDLVTANKEAIKANKEDITSNGFSITDSVSGIAENGKDIAINSKEIELLKIQIEEIKVSTSNPLTN